MQVQRINITLPLDLIYALRADIPARSRSKFIAEALRAKLNKKRNFKKELEKSFKANYYLYKDIEEDFKYADADVLAKLP